ncbi:hypothetical protein [Microbacterium sp. LWH3-1.2]|uniref:hypothetical protein n=1 Tax=Microbacterium sp. LWH3-1.2 TaxID=3135256 RepID=UPI00343D7FE4
MLTVPFIERDVSMALGREVPWDEVLALAASRQPAVERILDASGRALGTLIAAVANLTCPDLVIIGGTTTTPGQNTDSSSLRHRSLVPGVWATSGNLALGTTRPERKRRGRSELFASDRPLRCVRTAALKKNRARCARGGS